MSALERLHETLAKALEGKSEVIRFALTALLARGHLLVEDVPGVGKTTLARGLARALGVPFRRVQCTSDLLPSDVLGGSVFDPATSAFRFRPGPIFTSVLVLDEVNRASPRTQSALLEAMEERRVSLDGVTHELDEPFFVVATQNPDDFQGTFPLPESQLDRFLLRIEVGYPPPEVELGLLLERRGRQPVEAIEPVVSKETLLALQVEADAVKVDPALVRYVHELVLATRASSHLSVGASTRAALSMLAAVRAYATVQGRTYAVPDDVKELAVPALGHRVAPRSRAGGRREAGRAIEAILDRLPLPT